MIEYQTINGTKIGTVPFSNGTSLTNDTLLDVMMNCRFEDCGSILVYQHHLADEFFDLKTKVAGDLLQKFSTYDCKLAIVGNFQSIESKSLADFIGESNRIGRITFASTKEEAIKALSV
ncbi:MAG: alpha/beta hydrolase [Bacteroidetes bacterium]|nr:MAG: alpha/beta hydrolase [Bacteroidota bacterium]